MPVNDELMERKDELQMTDTSRGLCLAMDIGGTNVRLGLVRKNGQIVAKRHLSCRIGQGFDPFLASIEEEIEVLRREAELLHQPLLMIGSGIPGLIDNRGRVLSSVNLPAMETRNMRQCLEEISGLPVAVQNDANGAALAEWRYGAGRQYSSLLHFTLGTGVGSGLILNGQLWTGIDGIAAEYGHATVEPDGHPCPCGNRGCLEQYASATAIARMARKRIEAGEATSLDNNDGSYPDSAEVSVAAANGDPLALACFAAVGRYLGIAAASAVNMLNLEAIIIGGGVAQSYELLADHVRGEINRRAFRVPAERVVLLQGELGEDAGLLGAAAAGWQLLTAP